jgi:hypothetical protein
MDTHEFLLDRGIDSTMKIGDKFLVDIVQEYAIIEIKERKKLAESHISLVIGGFEPSCDTCEWQHDGGFCRTCTRNDERYDNYEAQK